MQYMYGSAKGCLYHAEYKDTDRYTQTHIHTVQTYMIIYTCILIGHTCTADFQPKNASLEIRPSAIQVSAHYALPHERFR